MNLRILADALCNAHWTGSGMHPHALRRKRGYEGKDKGIACASCDTLAEKTLLEYERITQQLRAQRPVGSTADERQSDR